MVNHVRTLLLNETQTSLSEAGLPYGSPWFTSPRFSGVKVPPGLSRVYSAVFSGCDGLSERIDRVNVVMTMLAAPDMAPFMGLFDTRSTVEPESSGSIRELFDLSTHSSGGFYDSVMQAARSSAGLFAHVGDSSVDESLDKLAGMARGSFESTMKVASVIVALCVQLDKARTK